MLHKVKIIKKANLPNYIQCIWRMKRKMNEICKYAKNTVARTFIRTTFRVSYDTNESNLFNVLRGKMCGRRSRVSNQSEDRAN